MNTGTRIEQEPYVELSMASYKLITKCSSVVSVSFF